MARYRWTLALILICLPILATVITAFRVRDLSKPEDSIKLDRKQKCDDCDVKFAHKLHSVKTESDKYSNENLKKVVQQQQIDEKTGSKVDVGDKNNEDLSILKVKSNLKKEYPSASKTISKTISSSRDVDDFDTIQKFNLPKKIKTIDIKNTGTKSSTTADTILTTVKFEGSRFKEYEDIDSDKKAVPTKPKLFDIKNVDQKLQRIEAIDKLSKSKQKDSYDSSDIDGNKKKVEAKLKLLETYKVEQKLKQEPISSTTGTSESISNEIEEDNISDNADSDEDEDGNDEEDDDEDDDDDGALSSLWETFSMWGLNIDPSLKPADKKEKESIPKTKEQDNDIKDKPGASKGLPKIREMTKKIDVKPVISNIKEIVTKKVTPKHVQSIKSDEDKVDNDVLLQKYKPKSNIKEIDKKAATKQRITNVDLNSGEDDDDDDIDFKLLEEKYKLKNKKKLEISKKLANDNEDDDDDDDDDDNDNDKDDVKIYSLKASKSKTSFDKDEKKLIATKKIYKISDKSTDSDIGDDDDDDHSGSNQIDKISNTKKASEKTPRPRHDIEDKTEIKKQILKGDKKTKTSQETLKPKKEDTNSSDTNQENKAKGDSPKITKSVSKNQTTINQFTKKQDEKEHKESKALYDKHKNETDKIDSAKDIKVKEKKTKSKDTLEKKAVESGPTAKVESWKDDLNMQDIKEEIEAQIRSNRQDKKSDKTSKEKRVDSEEMSSSTDTHLKQVTDALHRRNLLKSEFEDFYAFFPTFAPNFSRIHNPECRRHGQIVLRQLRGTKLWALNMLDATAKIPSGILQGNGIQLGDFEQCVGSRARVQLESGNVVKVQGKYCLARLDVKAEHPELEAPVHLAQAKNLIRSRIDDPGHFVPRFSTLSWGVCVPAVCNPEDVEVVIKDALKHYQKTSGVIVRLKVDEQDCAVEETDWWKNWIELPVILTLSLYGVVVLLVLLATLQDFFVRRNEVGSEEIDEKTKSNEKRKFEEKEDGITKKSDNFISTFSLYHTINKLVAPGTKDDIACIHGVRAIATIALLIAHKFLPVAVMPYTNRLKITELASSPLWSWCRAGWMFTDCFLLLSGALTAHKAANDDTPAPRRLFSRYMRLTPALLAVVLFYAYIWDNLSSGPMWGTFVTKNAEVCKEGWWWNLLYIQNYFGFEEMCAPQTHQLALDMQLTIIGGILLWLMQVKQGIYKLVMPALHIFAAYSRYTTVRDHRLTMLAYHGVSVSQLYRTARLSYTSVLHRSTPYLVGLSLGLAIKSPAEHGTFLLGIGWISSIALWCLVWWVGADSGSMQYRYSSAFAAQYASLAPIASALAIAWVVYAVHSGGSGFMSRFLSCRPLALISRLSYALYLTQFIVYITNVATVKTSREFTLMSLIDVQEISAIFLTSVILTVTFVIPMQSLHKIFTFSSKSKSSEQSKELNENKLEKETKIKEIQKEEKKKIELPQLKSRPHLIAHREVLEEIPEIEVEYESQRDNEGLGEILEEEEDDMGEESIGNIEIEDDLEIIEEEQGGEDEEDESWLNRRQRTPSRLDSNDNDDDVDEWEWTADGGRNGAQYYRYSR